MSRLYFSIFRIDLKKNFYEEISSDNSVHRLTGHRGMAQQKLNELCSTFVDPEYRLAVRQFFDLSTVPDRLADTDTVGMDYLATNGNCHQGKAAGAGTPEAEDRLSGDGKSQRGQDRLPAEYVP